MLAREQLIKNIVSHLGSISAQAEMLGRLHFFDLNIAAENFYRRLLNEVYGYNLINLNHAQVNAAAIDLADSSRGIAVQVTAQRTANKVQKTLDAFSKGMLGAKYPVLKILIIGKKTGKYPTVTVPAGVRFDAVNDVLDNHSIIGEIDKMSTSQIRAVLDVFEEEIVHDQRALSAIKDSDAAALLTLRDLMDCPALQDPWTYEVSYLSFQETITGLIEAINTGRFKGVIQTKPRFAYEDSDLSKRLNLVVNQLRMLRQLFQSHIVSGEIDLQSNTCKFSSAQAATAFDTQRNVICAHFNSITAPFGYTPLPHVS